MSMKLYSRQGDRDLSAPDKSLSPCLVKDCLVLKAELSYNKTMNMFLNTETPNKRLSTYSQEQITGNIVTALIG